MKGRFVAKTFEITPDLPDFYRDNFGSCIFILRGGESRFMFCRFEDCTFIPPLMDGEAISAAWDDLIVTCSIESPRTRVLIKSGEHQVPNHIPEERRCRTSPGEVCYNRDACVFECTRKAEKRRA